MWLTQRVSCPGWWGTCLQGRVDQDMENVYLFLGQQETDGLKTGFYLGDAVGEGQKRSMSWQN